MNRREGGDNPLLHILYIILYMYMYMYSIMYRETDKGADGLLAVSYEYVIMYSRHDLMI